VTDTLATLYPAHLAAVIARSTHALARGGFDHLLVAAGTLGYRFLDDNPYPFYVNPQFKAWLPLTQNPDCWIAFTPGARPVLVYHQPADYWHLPPSDPQGYWVEHFDVRVIREPAQARAQLPRDLARAAILGEPSSALDGVVPNNPKAVLDSLHLARTRKTPYELECMRHASRRGALAHRAAHAAFRQRGSEYAIHQAFCAAAGHTEAELPYGNIVALNEHGATLHYQHQQHEAPAEHRSLLIDAGAQVHGYASDITRTLGHGDTDFTHLLEAVAHEQQGLCAKVRPGLDWRDLQLDAHRAMGRVLQQLDIVRMDPQDQLDSGVSSVFLPHGIGHFIGLQVHDVGGFLKDESGETIPKPPGHPYLRCTRTLEPGNVVTVEPGIYFIDMLLDGLRRGLHADRVNWAKIEHLHKFGGVRIEDNVAVTDSAPENLTRDAFKSLAA
jgi:Xaa-Pro dipeptidase